MSEKSKAFSAPAFKKRVSTISTASSSRGKITSTAVKHPVPRSKISKNTTILGDGDTTIMKSDGLLPDFDAENKHIAYGKFLRLMLEDCLVDEKFEREETRMDIQMGLLADRFQNTMELLDKTSRRLKDISFVVEQKRLLDLKSSDTTNFFETTNKSNTSDILNDLAATEAAALDKLETKNIDFGYDNESGHKQLLDAVNDAVDGLEQIKKHSNLDSEKFKEYANSQTNIEDIEKDRMEVECLKADFEKKFPNFSEKLLKEASDKIALMIENDD